MDAESEPNYWTVRYDNFNSCHVSVTPLPSNPALVESLCVLRPCDTPRLWESLFWVMRLGSVVLYFPGCAEPLVASELSGEQLPTNMVETLGRPRVVRSGREIVEAIERA